jgi:PAS domain S-box-containing protein
MKAPLYQRLADGFGGEAVIDLRVRIFRLICAMTAGLCLGLVAPLNALQNLPLVVHAANVFLGLMGVFCYWQSCRGRHFVASFFVLLVVLLDVVWFYNAGSDGSVTHYYYPVMLFIIALFQGRKRRVLALGLWLNVSGLFVLEHLHPGWVTPFQGPDDRLMDLETGVFCSFVALVSVTWFILANYTREQQRVSEIAAKLVASEANYREIFNSTSDAMFVHALDGRILDVNAQAEALFATSRDRMVGRCIGDFSSGEKPYTQADATAKAQLALQGQPQLFEWRSRRASGELFWAEVALRACEWQGEQRVVAAVRDISSRQEAQEALRLNEERLRLAMEASRQGWFELNVATGETISSPEYVRMLGYEVGEFVSNLQVWMERIHPADREATLQAYRQAMQAGTVSAVEYRQQTKSGGWKWIRSIAKVVERDAEGRPVRVTGTHTDITERKELESQLLHSQRLEAVGTLASGVAHDLNNILTPMLMASGLLREKLADPMDRELMARLDDGGRRGAAIVRQLLDFSRNLAQDRVPLNPRPVLQEMAQLMRATLPKEIQVAESLAPGSDLVEFEPNQLHQVLMNLCVNARDAMPGGGTITLGLERAEIPAGSGTHGGPHLVLVVADTGTGIPPENLGRIFDPFFTTKPLGKGTGLGLASVHGIVKAHHGFVRVESQVGRGTVFRVFLPVKAGSAAVAAAAVPPAAPAAVPAGVGILVVDDDPAVLLVTGRMLERIGYSVVRAAGAAEALAALPGNPHVALVVTDFSMPGMDGPTLAPLLRKISPGVKIIGVSGLKQDYRAAELAAIGFSEVLSKPYEGDELVRAVQRHVPGRAGAAG